MPVVRALENRFFIQASAEEVPALRRIPTGREIAGERRFVFDRRDTIVYALDLLFPGGFEMEGPATSLAIAEARGRHFAQPEYDAHVHIEGHQLLVGCEFVDKELVKCVPGYRWSPAQKVWIVPARPLALELLRQRFGDRLIVDEDAVAQLELRALDEREDEARARAKVEAEAQKAADRAAGGAHETPPPATRPPTAAWDGDQPPEWIGVLLSRLEHLADGVDRLVAALSSTRPLVTTLAAPQSVSEPPDLALEAPATASAPEDWQTFLARYEDSPGEGLAKSRIQQQIATPELVHFWTAITGISAGRANEAREALRLLSDALNSPADALDPALRAACANAYVEACLVLVCEDCGAEVNRDTTERRFRDSLLAELLKDDGFDDVHLGSEAARESLSYLVDDPLLRQLRPEIAALVRVTHLLSIVRGGSGLARNTAGNLVRDPSLSDEAFAMAFVVYVNLLCNAKCSESCLDTWPLGDPGHAFEDDKSVSAAIARFSSLADDALGTAASQAVLMVIADLEAAVATEETRKALAGAVPPGTRAREYSDFLAVQRYAVDGQPVHFAKFPGYAAWLKRMPLAATAEHFERVLYEGHPKAKRQIADAYVEALFNSGISDPATEVIGLLEFFAECTERDAINRLAGAIEDGTLAGADRLSPEQRRTVYREALSHSRQRESLNPATEAFHRYLRSLSETSDLQAIRELALECLEARWRPLRLPAALELLGLYATGENAGGFSDSIERSHSLLAAKDREIFTDELRQLAASCPPLRSAAEDFLKSHASSPPVPAPVPSHPGTKLLLVGGHQRLRVQATPQLQAREFQVDWIDADSGNNRRLANLVRGSCDYVVVNTAYISHAMSNSASSIASSAGKPVIWHNQNGVGTLLSAIEPALH